MLSLDPRMNPDEMMDNLATYELKGIGAVVSLEDIKMVINRLRREVETHTTTKMILHQTQENILHMQDRLREEVEAHKKKKPCPTCGGDRLIDSGGQTPWGEWINIPCPTCNPYSPQYKKGGRNVQK